MPLLVLVTGTDTGVGKTHVTCGLARVLVARGLRVLAVKPLETGAAAGSGDGERLAEATGQREPRTALMHLRDPLTPALAADREGVTIDLDALSERIGHLASGHDVVLVEGAGGVLSPLTWSDDATTLGRRLGADRVLLVAGDRLGTISAVHTAAIALAAAGLAPAVIALSAPETPDLSTGTNEMVLRRRLAPLGGWSDRIVTVSRGATPESERGLSRIADLLLA